MSCKSLSGSFSLDVQELCRPCNFCTISVRWFTSIKDIKDQLKKVFKVPSSGMSLFHISSPKSLSNSMTLHDLGIDQSGHVLRVAINIMSNMSFQLLPSKDIDLDFKTKQMLSYVRQGFERSQVPAKTDMLDCTGGVYFLKAASGEKVAVFKPNDEEQGMPNNPKGHAGSGEEGLRPNFKPGQGYIRETAAYLFDFQNFCQVPPTTIVHCEHSSFHYPLIQGKSREVFPKLGSLQQFVHAGDTFEDISPSLIGTLELQKIAILDIRLLNCDRNSSNILAIRKSAPNTFHTGVRCRRDSRSSSMGSHPDDSSIFSSSSGCYSTQYSEDAEFNPFQDEEVGRSSGGGESKQNDLYELIPIDHGYCIPSRLRIDELDWIWFYCAQISKEVDPEIVGYVNSLDIEELVERLETQLKIPQYSTFLLRLSHRLLKEGIAAGLSLFDIASMIARTDEEKPSLLEKVIKVSEENAHRTIEMRSNRLNSRGDSTAGNSSSHHNLPMHKSPVRPSEENSYGNSLTPLGGSKLQQRMRGMSESKLLGEPRALSRVVQSAMNLEEMGREQQHHSQNSTPSGRNKAPKLTISAVHAECLSEAGPYLSSENIEKLCNSPHLPKFPSTSSFMQECLTNKSSGGRGGSAVTASSPGGLGEFYLAELTPLEQPVPTKPHQQQQNFGVSLGLSGSLLRHDGERIRTMQSVDSPLRLSPVVANLSSQALAQQQQRQHSRKPSGVSPSSVSGSYLHTGVLLSDSFSTSSAAPGPCDDLYYQHSEPIMIALRDSHSSTSGGLDQADSTSCEASSKEGSTSPKSFGDNFFNSFGSLAPSSEQKLSEFLLPSNCADQAGQFISESSGTVNANMRQNNIPFSSLCNNAAVAERPFPPRAEVPSSSSSSNEGKSKISNKKSRSLSSMSRAAGDSSSINSTSEEDGGVSSGGEEEEVAEEALSSSLLLPRDVSISSLGSLRSASNLHRTASFNAFESPAIYGDRSDHRQLTRLHREKRKSVEQTAEYQALRLKFAEEAVSSAVLKEARHKAQTFTKSSSSLPYRR